MLVYHCDGLVTLGYITNFQSDTVCYKSTFEFVFTLSGGAVSWTSVKQSCIIDSTKEILMPLGVVPLVVPPSVLFCDNSGVVA